MCTQRGPMGAPQQAARCVQCLLHFRIQNMHYPTVFRSHSLSKSREAFDFFFFSPGCFDTDSEFIITTSLTST